MSQAIRRVMTWVLPVPAPATTSSGPVAVGDRAELVRVEPAEQRLEARPAALGRAPASMTGTSSRQAGSWSSGEGSRRGRVRGRVTGSAGVGVCGRGGHVGSIAGRRVT